MAERVKFERTRKVAAVATFIGAGALGTGYGVETYLLSSPSQRVVAGIVLGISVLVGALAGGTGLALLYPWKSDPGVMFPPNSAGKS